MRTFAVTLTITTAIALCVPGAAQAQSPEGPPPPVESNAAVIDDPESAEGEGDGPNETSDAEDIVVVASRALEEEAFELPYLLELAPGISRSSPRKPRTVTDALGELPSIMVQKTSYGQGSPFIRGFTGFRTLTVVDGIRLNFAAMRDGPNQYTTLVDPLMLDRVEVLYGPSSVLYGSDAIGGTVSMLSRSQNPTPEARVGGRLFQRYASAEQSSATRVEANASNSFVGALVGGAYRDYEDLSAGRHQGALDNTGYDEWSGDAKAVFKISDATDLVFAYQRHEQDDVPRTHSTVFSQSYRGTDVGSDFRRDLTQLRELMYAKAIWEPSAGRRGEITLARQWISEDENRVRSNQRIRKQGFDGFMYVANGSFGLESSLGTITAGVDYSFEDVDSSFREQNPDGTPRTVLSRGPVADDSTYQIAGVFVQDRIPVGEVLELVVGGRYTFVHVDADDVDPDPTDGVPFESVNENYDAFVGSFRATYAPVEEVRFFGGVSQGFRAPNLSDLTRFDVSRSNELEIPAPNLDPEEFLTFEIGSKARWGPVRASLSYYYTFIEDLIVRFPTGATSVDGETIVTKDNVGDGYVHGVEFQGEWDFYPEFTLYGGFAWLEGQADTFVAPGVKREEPLSRMAPAAGLIGVRYDPEKRPFQVEVDLRIVDNQDRLSPRDEADTQRIPVGGTPGYSVLGARAIWEIRPELFLSAAVENITDRDYRIHGSGSNEPGTNFIVSIDWSF